ncbi:MAG: DNA topoisomerase III [Archangium sp.]|nr:DNA topoisomerase III [Archangium sp.]
MQKMTPSPQLAAVVGSEPINRVEVIKRVWQYIAKHKLQDAENRRMINVDATLKGVFGDKAQINMFEMTKLIIRHLS